MDNNREKALGLILGHNRLTQSVKIVELLLEGNTPKSISQLLKVSLPQIYKVRGKYIKDKLNED